MVLTFFTWVQQLPVKVSKLTPITPLSAFALGAHAVTLHLDEGSSTSGRRGRLPKHPRRGTRGLT
jgi:hypothetical protein